MESGTAGPGLSEINKKHGFNWGAVKPFSGLMPLSTSPPPVKPGTWSEGLLCSESSGPKLFAFAGGTIS